MSGYPPGLPFEDPHSPPRGWHPEGWVPNVPTPEERRRRALVAQRHIRRTLAVAVVCWGLLVPLVMLPPAVRVSAGVSAVGYVLSAGAFLSYLWLGLQVLVSGVANRRWVWLIAMLILPFGVVVMVLYALVGPLDRRR
jgi:hypothetical protein